MKMKSADIAVKGRDLVSGIPKQLKFPLMKFGLL